MSKKKKKLRKNHFISSENHFWKAPCTTTPNTHEQQQHNLTGKNFFEIDWATINSFINVNLKETPAKELPERKGIIPSEMKRKNKPKEISHNIYTSNQLNKPGKQNTLGHVPGTVMGLRLSKLRKGLFYRHVIYIDKTTSRQDVSENCIRRIRS